MNTNTNTPRIYVACLASYNAGKLRGVWTDATDADEINEAIEALLAATGGEEYAIHDHENFEGCPVNEHSSIDEVAALGAAIEEHGAAFAIWLAHYGSDIDPSRAVDVWTDETPFDGCYDSLEDWAYEYLDGTGQIDTNTLAGRYFDYERFARDCECGGDIWTQRHGGQLYVFRTC